MSKCIFCEDYLIEIQLYIFSKILERAKEFADILSLILNTLYINVFKVKDCVYLYSIYLITILLLEMIKLF